MLVFVCESCVCVCACLKSCVCSVMVRSVIVVMRKAKRVILWRFGVFLTFQGGRVCDLSYVAAFVVVRRVGG